MTYLKFLKSTLRVILVCGLCITTQAMSQQQDASKEVEKEREAFPTVADHILGESFRPFVFDWRLASTLIDLSAGQILELNNFESTRYTLNSRYPVGRSRLYSLSLSYVKTEATKSTKLIAKTPYRQPGRPSRFELDAGLEIPLAEGIVTQAFTFLPAAQLVFSASFRLRYLYYWGSGDKSSGRDKYTRFFTLELNNNEIEALEKSRLPGMYIDRARINALTGARFDMFFRNGFFLTQSTVLNIPYVFNDANGLRSWWDISAGLGYAF